ncbi:hypothetical protein EDD18DRAFT_1463532 [Armillaria luteobubalina]|uniref:DUF6533 domain-containing protein n=1 Tax=Armillaria luteobubalina TaxID=153913 RepID=A0AA39Q4L9_9AGAR|nr:hypothetical protein EDD18DRAFT_1463532 [Armillaria luteobubalina]
MSTVLPPADAIKAIATAGDHLRWEDSLALALVSLLLFEYLITFDAEVDYVWSKPKSFVSILYIANRYFGPLAITVCMIALFDTGISEESCSHLAPFDGIFTLVTVLVAEAMLIIRVYALHERSKIVLALHGAIWLVQTCLMSFVLAHSGPVVIPTTAITFGCVLVADPSIGSLLIMWTIPSLVFDTATFLLLVAGIWRRSRRHECSILTLIARDGILYFVAIVASNTLWTVTGLVLPSDLKNVWAFMSTVLTSILIARITINLRSHESQSVIVGPKMRSNDRSPNTTQWTTTSSPELRKSSPQDDVELQQLQLH